MVRQQIQHAVLISNHSLTLLYKLVASRQADHEAQDTVPRMKANHTAPHSVGIASVLVYDHLF